jgi:YHS domain-containing protein
MKHIDPVCGMVVKEESAKGKCEWNGKTYYFCNKMCEEEFKKDPEKYLNSKAKKEMPHKNE